jgi:hypothetical protein
MGQCHWIFAVRPTVRTERQCEEEVRCRTNCEPSTPLGTGGIDVGRWGYKGKRVRKDHGGTTRGLEEDTVSASRTELTHCRPLYILAVARVRKRCMLLLAV